MESVYMRHVAKEQKGVILKVKSAFAPSEADGKLHFFSINQKSYFSLSLVTVRYRG